ncbi:hypothetical protein TVNIR_2195 [Thioalkalivibrio nitratireducens DSM 14787]|uniref:Uncharacterized protein n=1 Tax=Thioalkalivibrio nitratireducens (strain DSM 14787 / UNIQEM 213 / ALEN2) TaxID=1255043 RepID=L0DZN4_THIND|nr:hypothetical protein [Thioalkalivibrio nitratireducens]AGA33851.1 hypothetical protein TVNIR_2195 [Thioalkalivibrio nitratireducens DSM 14787]
MPGPEPDGSGVQYCDPHRIADLRKLLARYGIGLAVHPPAARLPGSYWGEPEAGIVGSTLHLRPDTPVHSALHEACHLICMDAARRSTVHTDAGGNDPEEEAVCLLQVLLADHLPGVGRRRLMADMDAWGYSFRLGSTAAWVANDSGDARDWLRLHGLVDATGRVTFRLRDTMAAQPAAACNNQASMA